MFAWLVSFLYKPVFAASLILGYGLTNILGLVLMHKGACQVFLEKPPNLRRELLTNAIVSLICTAVIVVLIKLEIFKRFAGYFQVK